MSAFEKAFALVLGHEGGYVNHPNDPGGETKYGITKRTYPNEDIKNLTVGQAKAIYKRDFWDRVNGDELPPALALVCFDAAVNSGPGQAAKWLQAVLGVKADGVIGPVTLRAVASRHGSGLDLLVDLLVRRLFFMMALGIWGTFGKGWARRLFKLAIQAASMREE